MQDNEIEAIPPSLADLVNLVTQRKPSKTTTEMKHAKEPSPDEVTVHDASEMVFGSRKTRQKRKRGFLWQLIVDSEPGDRVALFWRAVGILVLVACLGIVLFQKVLGFLRH
jgi:hypothetical protein